MGLYDVVYNLFIVFEFSYADAETQGPAYFQLAQPVHSSLLTANFEVGLSL